MERSLLKNFSTEQIQSIKEFGSHMDAAIRGEYHYPHTIVFVPGISCMYKCTFCGRNYDANLKNKINIMKFIEMSYIKTKEEGK